MWYQYSPTFTCVNICDSVITAVCTYCSCIQQFGQRLTLAPITEPMQIPPCQDGDILASSFPVDTQVAYILSLGVVKEFRKHGIGELQYRLTNTNVFVFNSFCLLSECYLYEKVGCVVACLSGSLLLDSLKEHISTTAQDHCKAIYLHVLTTNNTAIHFYENRDFKQHHYLPYYYSIRGVLKDGFTYVLYINGGHPPWTILYPFGGRNTICSITAREILSCTRLLVHQAGAAKLDFIHF